MELTQTTKAKAVIIGSFIMYLLDMTLGAPAKARGSTINLRQRIMPKIKDKQYLDYIKLSNKAWSNVIDKHVDSSSAHVYSFDAIEQLSFSEYDAMEAFYGEGFFDLVGRFINKNTLEYTKKKYLLESRAICKDLISELKKCIFDYEKNK